MTIVTGRASRFAGPSTWLVLAAFLTNVVVLPRSVASQAASSDVPQELIQEKFEQVIALRLNGDYSGAVALLRQIVADYPESDEILQRAYNQLLQTHLVADDFDATETSAREALERFPTIHADELYFPPDVNATYDRLRREMFGGLKIIVQPEGAQVFLDGEYRGDAPLDIRLVRSGEHDLVVTKSGHHDYTGRISIEADVSKTKELELPGKRGPWWWIKRVGAVVVVTAGIVALVRSGGDESNPEIPNPPPPP